MPTAFRATFSDLKNIKTRQVVQLVFEVPLADFDAAYEVLGGLPDPARERWFGIAALSADAAQPEQKISKRAARDWRDLSPPQQAGIRCAEPIFASFLKEQRPDDWHEAQGDPAECVRLICGVKSRSELETNHKARVLWHQLEEAFSAWKAMERVA